jgi:hypothetical protein
MELIGSLFLVLALAVIVALYIGRPFFLNIGQEPAGQLESAAHDREHQVSTLLAERDRVLNALQELDFDYALGKIPAEEYPQQRAVLLKSGADVLRQLDEMAVDQPVLAGQTAAASKTAEDRIEAAVAARRADAVRQYAGQEHESVQEMQPPAAVAVNGGANGKDELEEIIALRKRERKESAAGFCPRCGKPAQKSDRFCSKCGATLSV